MSAPLRLLIVGTGEMARRHVVGYRAMEGVEVVGGVDPEASRRAAFCETHGIANSFASLEDALLWGQFDAASNVTPDSVHYATTLQLLAGGKHVFCEKPLATNLRDAEAMTVAAAQAGLVGMVNLTYRNVPALRRARDMVRAGDIGAVRHVEASYLQSWLTSRQWGDWRTTPAWLWRLSRQHGSSGVLGDVGIHVLDCATYVVGSELESMTCRLKTFHKAEGDRIGDYLLDANDSFAMSVEFENGALGVIHASRMATGYADYVRLRVFGDIGGLELDVTWDLEQGDRVSRLRACLGEDRHTQLWRDVELAPVENNYQRFVRAIQEGRTLEPSFAHATALQRWIDEGLAVERSEPGETFVTTG